METEDTSMLAVHDLTVYVKSGLCSGKKMLVQHITLQLYAGGSVGIVGPSGSGKTTIASAILGLVPISLGSITIDGKAVGRYKRRELAQKIQIITQHTETGFDPDFTIQESFSELIRIHNLLHAGTSFEHLVQPFLCDIGLEGIHLNKYPEHFSGGELQRLSIVRALLVAPHYIIFDEADSMLDTAVRLSLFSLLKKIQKKYHLGFIYITHDMRVLPHLVDTVLVIADSKQAAYGPVNLLKTSLEPCIQSLRSALTLSI